MSLLAVKLSRPDVCRARACVCVCVPDQIGPHSLERTNERTHRLIQEQHTRIGEHLHSDRHTTALAPRSSMRTITCETPVAEMMTQAPASALAPHDDAAASQYQ